MQIELLSITDAADRLSVTKQRVSQWLDEGRIPFIWSAGRRVIEARHCKKPKPRKPGPKVG